MKSQHWISLAALGLGLVAGLTYAWVISPRDGLGTPPSSLRSDYKDQWRETIAASYTATGELGRAKARLQLLGDTDSIQALSAQAQRALASGRPFEVAQELARLASDLQAGTSSLPSRTPRPANESDRTRATLTPSPQATPLAPGTDGPSSTAPSATLPTALPSPSPITGPTPLPSPSTPFELASQDKVCDPHAMSGLLQVTVLDSKSRPLPGIEITITWDQGTDRFFTGLQPEISPGYADYTMKGGTTYALQVARLGVPISGLTPPICTSVDNQPYLGGLRLTFSAP